MMVHPNVLKENVSASNIVTNGLFVLISRLQSLFDIQIIPKGVVLSYYIFLTGKVK